LEGFFEEKDQRIGEEDDSDNDSNNDIDNDIDNEKEGY
jgi:hypothetical protein